MLAPHTELFDRLKNGNESTLKAVADSEPESF
jgi:hypothetical protein